MLPWLLTIFTLGILLFSVQSQTKSYVTYSNSDNSEDALGRYNLTLQYPDHKYSPDVAYTGQLRRPVQQKNVLSEDEEFSWLGEDIAQGNPISWSNQPNPVSPFRPGQNSLCGTIQRVMDDQYRCPRKGQSEMVIQGHSVPLAYELYSSRDEGDAIVPFGRMRASLACCPSTYHTDQGCVCGL